MEKRSLRAGDSVEDAIDLYSSMVYKLAYSRTRNKMDADDVFQEVFIKLLRSHVTFDSEEHRKAWLIRTTIHTSTNILKDIWRKITVDLDEALSVSVHENSYVELNTALDRLPRKYRTVIHLFYYEHLSIAEIGDLLYEKPSTIRTQLTRARTKLRDFFDKEGNFCAE